jgi:5'-nucleotidase
LTNDDGIYAPGLWSAASALCQVGEVCVVAPDREQSGIGTALTLHRPVRARSMPAESYLQQGLEVYHPITAYAIEGTPGDSCILALEQLVGKVDLVVSGINTGSNLGWDIIVSGTVGAAVQGYVRGYPTIAISVASVQNPQLEGAAQLLRLIAHRCEQSSDIGNFFLNINVPSMPLEQITGVQVTRLAGRSYGESVRSEGTGHQQRYWISRNRPIQNDNGEGTDIWALKNNRISITPLHLDLANQDQVPEIETFLADLPAQLLDRED